MSEPSTSQEFVEMSYGATHGVGITKDGRVFSWATKIPNGSRFGQLGRGYKADPGIAEVALPLSARALHAWAGGSHDTGHTVILDTFGRLWLCGCDRWQQLGLGAAAAGSTGYTWRDGRVWQHEPQASSLTVSGGTLSPEKKPQVRASLSAPTTQSSLQ